jgi:glycosyltransferase involved in cell wall biosynthesis
LKILYHHRTLGDGAEGIHIEEMVNAFRQLGHEVRLIGPGVRKPTNDQKKTTGLVWVKRLFKGPAYEMVELAYNLFGFHAICKAVEAFKPDLIYDRYITFNYSAVAAARRYNLPAFLEVNAPLAYERDKEADETLYLKSAAHWIEKRVCCDASKTIVVSTPLKDYLVSIGVPNEKIMVLPNGVNTDKFYPKKKSRQILADVGFQNNDIVIGFVGILRPWHGIDMLLEAFRMICRQTANCKLLLVGDGPIRQQIEAQVIRLALKDRVAITGRIPHQRVSDYVALFDIAVSPKATFYASPMKIIEYMAQQKAVIAPEMPNIKDLICNGTNGVLFTPGSTSALADALRMLINDKSRRESLASNALDIVTNRLNWKYNARFVIEKYAEEV